MVGSLTLVFQRSFVGVPLGIGIGTAYGLFFAFGGWTIGWLLVRLRMIGRKGMEVGLGVAKFAAVYLIVLSSLDGTLEPFLIVTPSVVAVAVAMWRGHHYDRAVTK